MSTSTQTAALASFRERIDRVDEQLLGALAERIAICREVAEYKRDCGIPMMQPDRVAAVEERWAELAAERGLDADFARSLASAVIGEGCRVEDAIIGDGENGRPDSAGSVLARSAIAIDHVAIAVCDLDAAIAYYGGVLGFELRERRQISGRISGMDSAVMEAGGVKFVLVQGDSPESNVSRYIEAYGPGVQHVAIEVPDPQEAFDDLRARGCDLLTGIIHGPGLDQIFTKREPTSGIQLEIIARAENDGFDPRNVQELFEAMERENVF
ncbi:MAG TPA: chorismate mutase family protein [Conexibacter sp.]|jgi:chorismate mutase-like protein|nr:chorismate mutase family protein [Conexibacter sp.]